MPDVCITIEVFYFYAHKDERYHNELEKHLSLLHRQGLMTAWYDLHILLVPTGHSSSTSN